MDPGAFEGYIDRLVERLESDRRVLGVVGTGSTALDDRRPDRWSDHDLWIVVADDAEEFRQDPSWLPDADRLVLWLRETVHGMKAVYDDGHLVEVAVFTTEELEVARVNDYRVFFDREQVADRVAGLAAAEPPWDDAERAAFLAGQYLTNLLVGVSRFARGESLSAHHFVQSQAVDHLLELIAMVVPPQRPGALDPLDPRRRFERVYPAISARLERALRLPLPQAALALIDLAEVHVEPQMPDYPVDAARVISSTVAAILAAGEWEGVVLPGPPPGPIG